MVHPRTLIVCLLAALTLGFAPVIASAQDDPPTRPDRPTLDPAAIAERCIDRTQAKARRCVVVINHECERAVTLIERLLEEGKTEQAVLLSRRAVSTLNTTTRRCVKEMWEDAERCAKLLERLEAPELAAEVKEAAKASIEQVKQARADAIGKIRVALPDRPDTGDGE